MRTSAKESVSLSANIRSVKTRLKRRGLILAAVGACAMAPLTPLNSATQTSGTHQVQNSDEYAVYSAILSSQFAHTNVQQFVIRGKTRWIMNQADLDRVAPDVKSDTMSDFQAKNDKAYLYLLERRLDSKAPYVFADSDEIDAMFSQRTGVFADGGGWSRFYERYPNATGLITFSRVGLDSKKDQALVYLGFQRGYLGGSSRFLILSKADKSWKVEKQVVITLS